MNPHNHLSYWNTCMSSYIHLVIHTTHLLKETHMRKHVLINAWTHTYPASSSDSVWCVFLMIYINIYKSDLKAYWISNDPAAQQSAHQEHFNRIHVVELRWKNRCPEKHPPSPHTHTHTYTHKHTHTHTQTHTLTYTHFLFLSHYSQSFTLLPHPPLISASLHSCLSFFCLSSSSIHFLLSISCRGGCWLLHGSVHYRWILVRHSRGAPIRHHTAWGASFCLH